MANGPSEEDIKAMLRTARSPQPQQQQVGLQVAAPMNDVQLMCTMAAYLRVHLPTASAEAIAEEAFELTAQVTSLAADAEHIGLRDRVNEILQARQASRAKVAGEGATAAGSVQPDGRPKLVVVRD